jgi:pimeloyl-ACP methyl ester carboxylesterase
MLPKPPAEFAIEVDAGAYTIGGGSIFARLLRGPKFRTRAGPPRQAIFIHGEGMGGNHTLLERPARWLLVHDLFDVVILPDRRSSGRSSPHTSQPSLPQQAEDMRRLLEVMAELGHYDAQAGLTALGVSYGGLVALALAAADPRVTCVGMVAASFTHQPVDGLTQFLMRTGLMQKIMDFQLRRGLGKRPPEPVNFDPGYDAADTRRMSQLFNEALDATPAERAESMRLEYEATHNPAAASLGPDVHLEIPILQVVGEGDEVWLIEPVEDNRRRFPNLKRKVVPGAMMHSEVFRKAQAFYNALFELLKEETGP